MRRKWRCAHTGIGLAVAVGPGGRCTVPGLHLQRVRSLLLAIEHHLREDLSGLPIDLEVILPFVPVAVHHVISDLKRKSDHVENDTPFRTIIINLFPFLLITRCYLQHINKRFSSLVSNEVFFIRVHTVSRIGNEIKWWTDGENSWSYMIYQDWEELYDLSQVDVREGNIRYVRGTCERVQRVKLYNFEIVGGQGRKKMLFFSLQIYVKCKSNECE